MNGGPSDASERVRANGWRQGDAVAAQDSAALLACAVDRRPEADPSVLRLVVLTQDCDLVRSSDKEPYAELIAARLIAKAAGDCQNGRSPRLLDLVLPHPPGAALRCSIHDRFRVSKTALADRVPATDLRLGDDERSILRRWVARRYTRAPFPDQFNRRLDVQKNSLDRLFKGADAENVTAIYIAASSEELPVREPYRLKVRITAKTAAWESPDIQRSLERFEQTLADVLEGCPGIVLEGQEAGTDDIETMPEDDFTIGLLRLYKRLDADYRSMPDDQAVAAPTEQVDSP